MGVEFRPLDPHAHFILVITILCTFARGSDGGRRFGRREKNYPCSLSLGTTPRSPALEISHLFWLRLAFTPSIYAVYHSIKNLIIYRKIGCHQKSLNYPYFSALVDPRTLLPNTAFYVSKSGPRFGTYSTCRLVSWLNVLRLMFWILFPCSSLSKKRTILSI